MTLEKTITFVKILTVTLKIQNNITLLPFGGQNTIVYYYGL